ncbi:MAG TPA: hypothetical protein PLF01_02705, partial [Alphaproteobacteria bacterium]|nr:hypothetical protein [Alphaproteobacteria bacterium]
SVFRPIARADHRLKYKWQGEIGGIDSFMTTGSGIDLKAYYPALSCIDNPVFYAVKKMTERNGGNNVAPVMVFARAVLNDGTDGRGPHIRYLIDEAAQVSEWNHEHRNSDEATSHQQPPPAPYDSPLFLHYRR